MTLFSRSILDDLKKREADISSSPYGSIHSIALIAQKINQSPELAEPARGASHAIVSSVTTQKARTKSSS